MNPPANLLPGNTLHRLMFRDITRIFILCTSFLSTLVILGQGMKMRKLIVGLRPEGTEFFLLLFYMSPMFMLMIIPFSCMLSIFLTVLRMNEDRELVALKAGGISILQLLPVPLIFSALCCLAGLGISMHGIPWGSERFRDSLLQLAGQKAELNLTPGVFNQDINGLTMFTREFDQETKKMRQVMVEDASRGPGSRFTILAPTGILETDRKRGELVFHLRDGRIYRLEHNTVSILNFEDYIIRISLDKLLRNIELGNAAPREMSWKELIRNKSAIDKNAMDWQDRKLLVEIQKRFSMPISSLALGLFALPLAAGFEGSRRQISVGIALAAFMLYYFIYSLGITMGEVGYLHPVPAVWLPSLFFLALALGGLRLVNYEKTLNVRGCLARLRFRRRR